MVVSCEIDGKIWWNGTGASFEIESRIEFSQIRRENKAHHDNIQKLKRHVEKTYSYACRTINAKLKLPHLIILKHKNNQFPT